MSVAQIAQQRNLAENTVIGHMERLASQGELLALDHLLPEPERMRQIKEAFDICGDRFLKPAWEYLGAEFSYDELRLTRIYLQQEVLGEG